MTKPDNKKKRKPTVCPLFSLLFTPKKKRKRKKKGKKNENENETRAYRVVPDFSEIGTLDVLDYFFWSLVLVYLVRSSYGSILGSWNWSFNCLIAHQTGLPSFTGFRHTVPSTRGSSDSSAPMRADCDRVGSTVLLFFFNRVFLQSIRRTSR